MKNNYGTRSDASFDFVYTDSGEGEGDAGNKSDQSLVVQVDGEDKKFTAKDVTNLVSQQASATQKTQQVSAVLKACEKFGLEPDAFVGQAEGAFSVISDLIEKGMVDDQGNILDKKVDKNDINFPSAGDKTTTNSSESKLTDIVARALEPLTKKIGALEQDQTQLTRLRISDSIKGKFNNLEDKDISQLFAIAGADRSKTLVQHAEELSKKKIENHSTLRGEFAKEFDIDIVEFDANKLREKNAEGGAGALFEGKKFSFKKGEANLSPKKAMQEFFKQTG